jgi:hypothetical protein
MRKCVQGMYNIINGIFAALWAASLTFKGIRPEILKYPPSTQSINQQKMRENVVTEQKKSCARRTLPPPPHPGGFYSHTVCAVRVTRRHIGHAQCARARQRAWEKILKQNEEMEIMAGQGPWTFYPRKILSQFFRVLDVNIYLPIDVRTNTCLSLINVNFSRDML